MGLNDLSPQPNGKIRTGRAHVSVVPSDVQVGDQLVKRLFLTFNPKGPSSLSLSRLPSSIRPSQTSQTHTYTLLPFPGSLWDLGSDPGKQSLDHTGQDIRKLNQFMKFVSVYFSRNTEGTLSK